MRVYIQHKTPGPFSELEDIVTLQEAASELDNNCTPLLEPIPDPFEVPRDILPIQDTASEAIDPQKLKIHLVLKLEKLLKIVRILQIHLDPP